MHPLEPIIYGIIIISVVLFLLWLACLFLGTKDDEAAGVSLGQISHEEDSFLHAPAPAPAPSRHFISACMYCHHVTRSDAHPVRVGDELRVSHGICDSCMAAKHPEVAHIPAQLAHA